MWNIKLQIFFKIFLSKLTPIKWSSLITMLKSIIDVQLLGLQVNNRWVHFRNPVGPRLLACYYQLQAQQSKSFGVAASASISAKIFGGHSTSILKNSSTFFSTLRKIFITPKKIICTIIKTGKLQIIFKKLLKTPTHS